MGESGDETRRLAKIIEHPVRARIIELLGEKGPLGWKELSQELGVKTGALYHHLDTLEGFIERNASKKYALTKSGMIVYEETAKSRTVDSVHKAALEIKRQGQSRRFISSIFVPRSLIASLTKSRPASAAVLIAAMAVFTLFAAAEGLTPYLYYLRPDPGLANVLIGVAWSLGALLATCYVAARAVFKSAVDVLPLAAATAISFIPAFVFSGVSLIPAVSTLLSSSTTVFTLFEVVFQTWSATMLGAGLSVASGVRIEKTLLVSLAVVYATMFLMLVRG